MSTVEMIKDHIDLLNRNLKDTHSDELAMCILGTLSAAYDTLVNAESEQNRLKHLQLYEAQQGKRHNSVVSVPVRHKGLSEYSTKELIDELVLRDGVKSSIVPASEKSKLIFHEDRKEESFWLAIEHYNTIKEV